MMYLCVYCIVVAGVEELYDNHGFLAENATILENCEEIEGKLDYLLLDTYKSVSVADVIQVLCCTVLYLIIR